MEKPGIGKPVLVAIVSLMAALALPVGGRGEEVALAIDDAGPSAAGPADGLESGAAADPEERPEKDAGTLAEAPREIDEAGSPAPVPEPVVPPAAVRCRVKLDVVGELIAPAGRDVPAVRRPIAVDARFDYDERPVPAAAGTVSRSYADAVAEMRIGDEVSRASLAADARHVLVVRRATTAMPYLEGAFLTDDEHALLETPFDSLLLDELAPSGAVAVGESWEIPADLTAGLLAIDTVESGKLQARLEEVVAGRARITVAGAVDGGVDGAPTRVEVSGSFSAPAREVVEPPQADDQIDAIPQESASRPRRHRLEPRIDHVAVTMRERRQAGHVAPGFDVEARLVVARTEPRSGGGPSSESAVHDAQASRRRGDGGPGRVWHRDADGRFDLVHDSRWRPVEDGPSGLVMRLVDRGALVGQCSITPIAATGIAAPTIAEVQQDIERSLAGEGARIDAATMEERADGTRIVRVASSGTAERLPFHWIHYVVVSPHGRRIDVAFMTQESMRGLFADADRDLVASLLVADGIERPDTRTDEAADPPPVREARAGGPTPPPAASPK